MNNTAVIIGLFIMLGLLTSIVIMHKLAMAQVAVEVEKKFFKDCSLESGTAPPHLDVLRCPNAKDAIVSSPGGANVTTHDLDLVANSPLFNPDLKGKVPLPTFSSSPSSSTSSGGGDSLTDEMTRFQKKANDLKQEIDSTTFTPGNGVIKGLTEKMLFFRGEVSVIGRGSLAILSSTEDHLIDKIKQAGSTAFSPEEQSEIRSWINFIMEKRKENPHYSSDVLGSNFNSNQPSLPSPQEQQNIPSSPPTITSGCPDGYHISPDGSCERTHLVQP